MLFKKVYSANLKKAKNETFCFELTGILNSVFTPATKEEHLSRVEIAKKRKLERSSNLYGTSQMI